MKKVVFFILFLSFITAQSQDVIVKKDGNSINAKVKEIGVDIIKYYKFNNLSGPVYSINKKEVVIVNFENGTFELITVTENENENEFLHLSKEETKELIVNYINNYSFVWKYNLDKYVASFKGDLLYLNVHRKEGLITKKSRIYDFSRVYSFNGVSIRGGDKVAINIFISSTINDVDNIWKKTKLSLGVIGLDRGEKLWEAFKHYNMLLLEKGN